MTVKRLIRGYFVELHRRNPEEGLGFSLTDGPVVSICISHASYVHQSCFYIRGTGGGGRGRLKVISMDFEKY